MTAGLRMSAEEYSAFLRRRGAGAAAKVPTVAPIVTKPAAVRTSKATTPDERIVRAFETKQRVQALGRLKAGEMNKTEERYAQHLEDRKRRGEIVWYRFEGIKFRLADNAFYTPDFVVLLADGSLEAHEVKGHWQDDARVKIKVAADMYPVRFIAVMVRPKKDGGGWSLEDFSA